MSAIWQWPWWQGIPHKTWAPFNPSSSVDQGALKHTFFCKSRISCRDHEAVCFMPGYDCQISVSWLKMGFPAISK